MMISLSTFKGKIGEALMIATVYAFYAFWLSFSKHVGNEDIQFPLILEAP